MFSAAAEGALGASGAIVGTTLKDISIKGVCKGLKFVKDKVVGVRSCGKHDGVVNENGGFHIYSKCERT